MPRFAIGLALASTVACGRIERSIGTYTPDLGQAGAAGAPGSEVSTSDSLPMLPSSGCGKALPDAQIKSVPGTATGFTGLTATFTPPSDPGAPNHAPDDLVQQFLVRVPADYDPNRPYRIVYLTRAACDGEHPSSSATYALYDESQGGSEQAVYVDINPGFTDVKGGGQEPNCYDTSSEADPGEYDVFDLVHTYVESTYCVDNNRIFVAGRAQGGALANMWGCYFGGIPDPPRQFSPKWAIRGHAVVAGWREPNQPLPCNGPDAGIWIHDIGDTSQGEIPSNASALQLSFVTNGCSGEYGVGPREPWAAAPNVAGLADSACQRYTGCPRSIAAEYPLVFCDVPGDGQTDQAQLAIPIFTAFFKSMDPAP